MIVLFSAGASEIFAELPEAVKHRAARSIELLASQPRMYPVRSRGIMPSIRPNRFDVVHLNPFGEAFTRRVKITPPQATHKSPRQASY